MIPCSHCGKELDRRVFCNASHRQMYHRHTHTEQAQPTNKPHTHLVNGKREFTYSTGAIYSKRYKPLEVK